MQKQDMWRFYWSVVLINLELKILVSVLFRLLLIAKSISEEKEEFKIVKPAVKLFLFFLFYSSSFFFKCTYGWETADF